MSDLLNKINVIETAEYNGAKFELIEISNLEGASSPKMGMELYFGQQAGLKMRQVRVTLSGGSIKTESGALYYYKGNIQSQTKMGGVGGFLKKSLVGGITDESAAKPLYQGNGEIYLEPSFKHYLILNLNNTSIIVDKGLFYCCSGEIDISVQAQGNVSSALLGGEGIFQIKLSGTGVAILELTVPSSEIVAYQLQPGEEMKVDGNFAIARTDSVQFSVTKSDKSILGSMMNGEGFLNTFVGPGIVWLAPTAPFYNEMLFGLPVTNNSFNNSTNPLLSR